MYKWPNSPAHPQPYIAYAKKKRSHEHLVDHQYLQTKLLMFYYDINYRQKNAVFGHLITLDGINSHLELFIWGRK